MNKIIENYYLKVKTKFPYLKAEEKKKFDNIFKVNLLAAFSTVYIFILFLITTVVTRIAGEKYRYVVLILLSIILIRHIYLTGIKLRQFYEGHKQFKKIFIRDNISLILGIIILYISEGIVYINSSVHNVLIYFIGIFFFIPTMLTNEMIAIKFSEESKKYSYYDDKKR